MPKKNLRGFCAVSKMLTVLASTISNSQVFFAEKM